MATGKYQRWLTKEGQGLIEAWARDGLTDEQLAKAMGISASTFYAWVKKHSEISEALSRGRGGAREQIENALYLAALGGVQTVRKPMKRRIREYHPVTGKCLRDEEEIVTVEEEVYIKPDVEAEKFYLTNRSRDRWTEHPEPADTDGQSATVVVDI